MHAHNFKPAAALRGYITCNMTRNIVKYVFVGVQRWQLSDLATVQVNCCVQVHLQSYPLFEEHPLIEGPSHLQHPMMLGQSCVHCALLVLADLQL